MILTPVPNKKTISTLTSINWIEDGILHSSNVGSALIDLDEAKRITAAFAELSPETAPLLVDLGAPKGQTVEARKYFSADPGHLARYSAAALLITNPIAKVLGSFYLGLNRPARPTRLFTDVDEARAWLRTFLVDHAAA